MPRNYNRDVEKKRKDVPLTRDTASQFWHNGAARDMERGASYYQSSVGYANQYDRSRIEENRTAMRKASASKAARANNRIAMRKQTASRNKKK